MTIGERIKNRRLELGMSADDIADLIGKGRATIYRYENGEIEKLPTTVLEPIAKALQTTPAYLMGWEDEKQSQISIQSFKEAKDSSQNILLSEHETKLILSYRNQSKAVQTMIDKMLDITSDSSSDVSTARIAAYGGGTFNHPSSGLTNEDIKNIKNNAQKKKILDKIKANQKGKE